MDRFVAAARSRPLAAALIAAIEDSTSALTQDFPAAERDPDEVPNRLIEL